MVSEQWIDDLVQALTGSAALLLQVLPRAVASLQKGLAGVGLTIANKSAIMTSDWLPTRQLVSLLEDRGWIWQHATREGT